MRLRGRLARLPATASVVVLLTALLSPPALAAPGSHLLSKASSALAPLPVVVRGGDNGVWQSRGAGWSNLQGRVIGPPVAVAMPQGASTPTLLVATGTDHDVWGSNGDGTWNRLSASPVWCQQAAGATVLGNVLHVGCQGGDGALWAASAALVNGGFPPLANWSGMGGLLRGAPSAVVVQGTAEYLAIGLDSHVWERVVGGGWSQTPLQCYGHPDAAAAGGFAVVGCQGTDNAMWYQFRTTAGWSAPQSAQGQLTEVLDARPAGNGVTFDVSAYDSSVWTASVSSSGASGWSPAGGAVVVTAERPYLNGIPFYRQIWALDCETAALQMGLATYGFNYSQQDLFSLEAVDARRAYWDGGGTLHWGDPYTNFVGDVHGREGNYTGYGIYYPPILAIAQNRGLPNAVGGEGWRLVDVYNSVAAGHPVEAWTEYQWARPAMGYWRAWDDRWVRYSTFEHAVVLTGLTPDAVQVNDPAAAGPAWISRATFEASFADFNNMAVVFQ